MDAIEFAANYGKYIREIEAIIRLELFPVLNELKSKQPDDLIPSDRWFTSENEARGFVWTLFVEGINKYSYEQITIDIDDIKSLEDIELFFILLEKEHILYSPETSFSDTVNTDFEGNTTLPTFTKEESDRLDMLMGKCRDLADELDVNIFEIAKRANLIIQGKNHWNQSPPDE